MDCWILGGWTKFVGSTFLQNICMTRSCTIFWIDESHRYSFRELDFKLSRYKARNQRPRVLLVAENAVKHVYEVKCLRFDEAFQLFYQFAMKQKPPSDRFKQLSVRAIKLVGFLPLALKVTASMLYDKEADDWETILQSLEEKQDNKGSKLEVSAK
ncbi:unnamed protein product [Arabis nemorensis]|uniref:Uncharacterized protein n=1 Tax=Arabis nemorensis TaxID=586526 RepID=A0A565ASS4_9BRAS|nr:unnamed protein product [Arabis nemorensis]